ncbi:aldehyde dehydrogenase [Mycobacterium sp. 852002-51152_SCH6134967]|uniref:aldehyde dehydrogenase n=1 Tax=Mycobacterium sp. 852002-51152_SCH6134967 TaxID=1834096 RepID=UPI000800BC53|nr:aldehyde dehydrogenase [Mycobacterium sp. 852002-51152_SCH6134967]OBF95495.1 aldehyde dehydrogenase [Mycobacterium sp. 852002-51152_SCH6134967]
MPIDRSTLFIGGGWVAPSSSSRVTALNAATEDILGTVPEADLADVDRAVAAARNAVDNSEWSATSPADRAAAMNRFADAMEKRSAELTRTVSQENGMPIGLSEAFEGGFATGLIRYYAELATAMAEEETRPSQTGLETVVRRSPVGVVAAIVPWNYPVVLAMSKIAPALAAGCTVVVKPSPPATVLDSFIVAEALEAADLPPGVVNWVPGGPDIGAYLVSHPGVDKVAFTGSTAAGRSIATACANLLRPVTLELGGKSAAILLDDVDLDAIMGDLQFIMFMNNGQTCVTCGRILAPTHRYAEVVDALATQVSSLRVGDPLDPSTDIGPMATGAHRERVESYIEKGRGEARLVAGGGRPTGLEKGWFVEPTVFACTSNDATIAKEEIFGPVLAVIPYDDEGDAVRIANDSSYGLGGTVFSADTERAKEIARQVHTGTIGVNGYPLAIGSPFGGVKDSGIGREFGPEALHNYQDLKSMYIAGRA